MSKKRDFSGGLVYSTNPDALQPNPFKEQETIPNNQQKLKVKLDTKQRAGKVVTLIEGFVGTQEDLESLSKVLKTKCGTGGSAKDGLILIQGDYKIKVVQLLQSLNYQVK